MRLFALAVLLIVLFGCASNPAQNATTQSDKTTAVPDNVTQNSTANISTPEEPMHITMNLSISREIRGDILTTDTVFPKPVKYDFTNRTTEDGRLIVYFFYSPYCSACKALRPEIDRLEAEYATVLWNEYDITTQNGTKAYQDFAAQENLSMKERMIPQVFVNGTVITDRFKINSTLGSLIGNFSAS